MEEFRPEDLARMFHENYERLAPEYSYQTRKASAVPWESVPENNKKLMVRVAWEIMYALYHRGLMAPLTTNLDEIPA